MPLTDKQKKALLRELGKNIETMICEKFKNKEEFLRKTGIYRKSLHDVLTGAKDARVSTIFNIAKELGISPRMFFPDTE